MWTKTPARIAHKDAVRYGPAWKKARQGALNRAGHRCEKCGSRRELSVDHIHGVAADSGHHHLQVLCGPCHRVKTATESNKGRSRSRASSDRAGAIPDTMVNDARQAADLRKLMSMEARLSEHTLARF